MAVSAVSEDVQEAVALSELEIAAWQGFVFSHSGVLRDLDAMLRATAGISAGAFGVLHLLTRERSGLLRVTEIADRTCMTASGVSRIVATLAEHGLVERRPDDDDGRAWRIALTPAGAERVAKRLPAVTAFIRERFTGRFSPDELAAISSFWSRIEQP
jgi:DNA-binding MarR family transcriptional regulator